MINCKLETDRLILRKYQEDDVEDYFEYMSQHEIGDVLGFPVYTDKESVKNRLLKEIERDNFAIVLKEESKVIGHISVFPVKPKRYIGIDIKPNWIEIGFLLSKYYWGKGIMPEAVSAVIDYIFNNTQYEGIILGHKKTNKQSERLQDKLGFVVIKEIVDEDNYPFIARKMTKNDWLSKKK